MSFEPQIKQIVSEASLLPQFQSHRGIGSHARLLVSSTTASSSSSSPPPSCQIRPDRQTLLWSATWPNEVQVIAQDFLKNPYKVRTARDTSYTRA